MTSNNFGRRLLCIVTVLVLVVFTLGGCGGGAFHRHSFDEDTWVNTDADTHWHPATCGHADAKGSEEAHSFVGNVCSVCGYNKSHVHTFDDTKWASDSSGHWHPATCAHTNQMKDKAEHDYDEESGKCKICGREKDPEIHVHTFDDTVWVTTDEVSHWHPATCEHDTEKSNEEVHTYREGSNECRVCGSTAHVHTYDETRWVSLDNAPTYHAHPSTCGHSNQYKDKQEHTYTGGSDICNVCGSVFHEHEYDTSRRVNTDPLYHWYPAICEHTDQKGSMAPHIYYENSNACAICGYKNTNLKPVEPEQPAVIKPFANTYNTSYKPTTFSPTTLKSTVTKLGDGVNMVKTTFTSTANKTIAVWTVEVELDKANVVAGTKNNTTDPMPIAMTSPYNQSVAWENANPGGHVFASLNADFFGYNSKTGLAASVNAFVKDGVIMKDGHDDWKGIYSYTNSDTDVPASAPMLFGVKGTKAQVTSMIKYTGDPKTEAVKKQLIKAKLSYATHNKIEGMYTEYERVSENATPTDDMVGLLTAGTAAQWIKRGAIVLKVDISGGMSRMKVLEKNVLDVRTMITPVAGNYGYIVALESNQEGFEYYSLAKVGDYVLLGERTVRSPDGTWNGYETIIGCRHALVIDGEIADTVAVEWTNAAKYTTVPRSAVGIKEGRVVIFAVEGLRYNTKLSVKSTDPHGISYPALADFMKYYGIENGATFDGGGSTKLITKATGGSAVTQVRSSDYGSTSVTGSARSVVNSILVVNRPN